MTTALTTREHVRTGTQNIAWFWDLQRRKELNLDPPYQRRSVWSQEFRDYFIDTILLNYPCPPIFVHEDVSSKGKRTINVVDGKQRLLTVFRFLNGEYPISSGATDEDLRGLYFSQLSAARRQRIFQYTFTVQYLLTNSPAIISNMFDRMNRNVARLSAQELRHASFRGRFMAAVETQAAWLASRLPGVPHFLPTSRAQMKDHEFVSAMLLMYEAGPRHRRPDELDEAFAEREENWPTQEATVERFQRGFEWLREVLRRPQGRQLRKSRLRNQGDIYSLLAAASRLEMKGQLPTPKEAAPRLLRFFRILPDDAQRESDPVLSEYYLAARAASSDTNRRLKRMAIMEAVLTARWQGPA